MTSWDDADQATHGAGQVGLVDTVVEGARRHAWDVSPDAPRTCGVRSLQAGERGRDVEAGDLGGRRLGAVGERLLPERLDGEAHRCQGHRAQPQASQRQRDQLVVVLGRVRDLRRGHRTRDGV